MNPCVYIQCPVYPLAPSPSWGSYPVGLVPGDAEDYLASMWTAYQPIGNWIFFAVLCAFVATFFFKVLGGLFK